jgi:hypothetical protein
VWLPRQRASDAVHQWRVRPVPQAHSAAGLGPALTASSPAAALAAMAACSGRGRMASRLDDGSAAVLPLTRPGTGKSVMTPRRRPAITRALPRTSGALRYCPCENAPDAASGCPVPCVGRHFP